MAVHALNKAESMPCSNNVLHEVFAYKSELKVKITPKLRAQINPAMWFWMTLSSEKQLS